MEFDTWSTFFGAFCLIAISPGSGAVLSMSHGLSYGAKRVTVTILGMELGWMLIVIIAGAGICSVLLVSETAFKTVKIIGAIYLIHLGWRQWRAPVLEQIPTTDSTALATFPTLSVSQRFITGFLTNATNPKAIVFMIAVLPQFIDQNRPLWPQLWILGLTAVGIELEGGYRRDNNNKRVFQIKRIYQDYQKAKARTPRGICSKCNEKKLRHSHLHSRG
ncbi:MAG: lysine transporter LysE [Solimicrobium sp.]|jgi:homoserine/homoserine lactone efflux protein|nr:lysine transporter LysE [Solimicrobium sp.]